MNNLLQTKIFVFLLVALLAAGMYGCGTAPDDSDDPDKGLTYANGDEEVIFQIPEIAIVKQIITDKDGVVTSYYLESNVVLTTKLVVGLQFTGDTTERGGLIIDEGERFSQIRPFKEGVNQIEILEYEELVNFLFIESVLPIPSLNSGTPEGAPIPTIDPDYPVQHRVYTRYQGHTQISR